MRTLRFIIDGQTIRQDPKCDFSRLAPGSNQHIQAEFTFSKEWISTPKVAAFYSRLGTEYEPQALNDAQTCTIPTEALKKRMFKIQIFGANGLITNKIEVLQEGG
jgi:hypothetical protein